MDRDYIINNEYVVHQPVQEALPAGLFAAAFFPFQVTLSEAGSGYINLYTEWSSGLHWVVNLIFFALTLLLMLRRSAKLKLAWPELLIVALTGIYGFIAVHAIVLVPQRGREEAKFKNKPGSGIID